MKIAIGIPTYAHFSLEDFNICLLNALQDPGLNEVQMCLRISDSLVSRARNNIVHAFMKSDADKLLFIDSDIIFTPNHIRRVIDARQPICCGAYAKKKAGPASWVATGFEGVVPDESGLQRIREAGTGFMLIDRSVFAAMIEAYPEIHYYDKERVENAEDLEDHYDFFSVGVVNKRYMSEDWYFCHRARELGFDIWLDTRVVLGHKGLIQFPIEP